MTGPKRRLAMRVAMAELDRRKAEIDDETVLGSLGAEQRRVSAAYSAVLADLAVQADTRQRSGRRRVGGRRGHHPSEQGRVVRGPDRRRPRRRVGFQTMNVGETGQAASSHR